MSADDDEFLLTAWRAKMFTASIAAVLGWTEARTANRLARLRCAGVPKEAPAPDAPKIRYARWFLAAGWNLAEIAWLFDLDVEELGVAIL